MLTLTNPPCCGLTPASARLRSQPSATVELPQTSGLLAVSKYHRSGIIICHDYYADFIGPGAAISTRFDRDHQAVIAIAAPQLVQLTTFPERYQAYRQRMLWIRYFQRLIKDTAPDQRVEILLDMFRAFFSAELTAALPDELLARLIGVLPQRLQAHRGGR